MVNNIWLEMSGGVIIAEITKVTTTACLRYFRINSGVINTNLDKKNTIKGNSNTNPQAKVTVVTVVIKEPKVIWFCTISETW